MLHDALVTDAGTWYRVVGVETTRSYEQALALPVGRRKYKIKLVLERVADQDCDRYGIVAWPDDHVGVALPFQWYSRTPKR
jgi:hypothetical protein